MRLDEIAIAAELCRVAYLENPGEAIPGATLLRSATHKTDDAFLLRYGGRTWVVFRGTEFSFAEWLKNFQLLKIRVSGLGRVHRGFFDNLAELWNQLDLDPEHTSPRLIFIGHSRGGALAQLAALVYASFSSTIPRVITFGQPRVGGWSWRKHYNAKRIPTARITQTLDPVPCIPVLNYWHVGEQFSIGRGSHFMSGYSKAARKLF